MQRQTYRGKRQKIFSPSIYRNWRIECRRFVVPSSYETKKVQQTFFSNQVFDLETFFFCLLDPDSLFCLSSNPGHRNASRRENLKKIPFSNYSFVVVQNNKECRDDEDNFVQYVQACHN